MIILIKRNDNNTNECAEKTSDQAELNPRLNEPPNHFDICGGIAVDDRRAYDDFEYRSFRSVLREVEELKSNEDQYGFEANISKLNECYPLFLVRTQRTNSQLSRICRGQRFHTAGPKK